MKLKKVVFYIIMIFLIMIFTLTISEFTIRCFTGDRYYWSRPLSYVPDPDTGFWHNKKVGEKIGINSFGMFDRERVIQKDSKKYRVAIIGDSFIEGMHVGYGKRVSEELEKIFNGKVEALNFGISSMGTVEEMYVYRHKVRQFKPDLVILAFLANNDIRDNNIELEAGGLEFTEYWEIPHCKKKISDGKIVCYPAKLKKAYRNEYINEKWYSRLKWFLLEHFYLTRFIYNINIQKDQQRFNLSVKKQHLKPFDYNSKYAVYVPPKTEKWQTAWDITEYALKEMKNNVEADGAQFVLMIIAEVWHVLPNPRNAAQNELGSEIPENFDVDYPTRRLVTFAEKNNIVCLNLVPLFRNYAIENNMKAPYFSFINDGHWAPLGHKVAALYISDLLKKNYLK